MTLVSFTAEAANQPYLTDIINRAAAKGYIPAKGAEALAARMDIAACHANGCRLDLKKFAEFDNFNFAYDFFGIRNHLDRESGKLVRCFLPRCSRSSQSASQRSD